jgi:cation transport regulator ChaB
MIAIAIYRRMSGTLCHLTRRRSIVKPITSAWDQYDDPEDREGDESREATAHQVAWSAVKQEYKKNDDGEWVKKEEGE